MSKIYITGHRNPDMDSVCAAYAYASLKNQTDPDNEYVPVRCGHLSDAVKSQFAKFGLVPPQYKPDVFAKVGDVMLTDYEKIQADDPIYHLIQTYKVSNPSVVPVFEGDSFYGLLNSDDITAWFLNDNSVSVPVYRCRPSNIARVLPGSILHQTSDCEFDASLTVAAASIEEFKSAVGPDAKTIVIVGNRDAHLRHAIDMNVPAIIVTAEKNMTDVDFSNYKGFVYSCSLNTSDTVRRLRMVTSIREMMGSTGERIQASDLFDEGKEFFFSNNNIRGLAVFDGERFAGYVTRRCFLKKPCNSVILVDHNEPSQSIRGIDESSVIEIIDHHRLAAVKTSVPIFIDAEPLGSTCTIIARMFGRNSVVPSREEALVLLSGIIADTVILKSPTTTRLDVKMAEYLAEIAGIESIQTFGTEMFSSVRSLRNTNPKTAIGADFKLYRERGVSFGIGQCETTTLMNLNEYSQLYLEALDDVKSSNGLDWALLMITDVLKERSVLLVTDYRANKKLPYRLLSDGIYDMPGIMSRKKQLLPEIAHVLEL